MSCEPRGEEVVFGLAREGVMLSVDLRTGMSMLCRGLEVGVPLAEPFSDFKPACLAATALASLSCSRSFALFLGADSGLVGAAEPRASSQYSLPRNIRASWAT